MQKLIKAMAMVSVTMANTVYSCLTWSGATRFIASYGLDDSKHEEYLYLAGLATKITNPELRPSAKEVITLLSTPPEQEKPNEQALKALALAGEDTSAIEQTLAEEHNLATARFTKQLARIVLNEKTILAALEPKMDKGNGKIAFVKLPQQMEEMLIAKLWTKLQARRARLIVDISAGRFVEQSATELGAINKLLATKVSKAA